MLVNNQEEIWITLNNNKPQETAIISISNCGRMKRKSGVIEDMPYGMRATHNGKQLRCHQLLMDYFKPQTLEDKLLGRYYVDHKTHHPVGMNINDVRNLRWCTIKENNSFEERRNNLSIAMKGEKNPRFGGKFSEEAKLNMSLSHKGKPSPNKGKHWKLVQGKRVYY